MSEDELIRLKRQELELRRAQLALQDMLPHRYGMPWYTWAYEFFISRNRENFLIAGNQVSKSSTQIRKCIEWSTNKSIWPELWPDTLSEPNCIWYFYPTMDVADAEYKLKWSQFLPKDKDHPIYGYSAKYEKGKIARLEFNSGMTVYFKSYKQSPTDLQTGTVFAIFADEELPILLWPELFARLNATDGYFHMVFTATIGQEFWRLTIEPTDEEKLRKLENFPRAAKWRVDLERGDCTWYMDGTASPWTKEKVAKAIARCRTETEKARRINGRFVVEGGLRYESFTREHNTTAKHIIPRNWLIFGGIDYGSGGEGGHPSAYVFVGVSPDFRQGRVFKGRRFDDIVTTAGDVIENYAVDSRGLNIVTSSYDFAAKDLYTIASRLGMALTKAEKARDAGADMLNTLFQAKVLKIFEDDPELSKLVTELLTLKKEIHKSDAKDDFIDALRYAIMAVPWDLEYLQEVIKFDNGPGELEIIEVDTRTEAEIRREDFLGKGRNREETVEDELAEWDELINDVEFF